MPACVGLDGLDKRTSNLLREGFLMREAHVQLHMPTRADWPAWKHCSEGEDGNEDRDKDKNDEPQNRVTRCLRTHISDESTLVAEGEQDYISDTVSVGSSNIVHGFSCSLKTKSRPRTGRRQKARKRREDFAEACKRSYADSQAITGGDGGWAHSALTSMIECFDEDDADDLDLGFVVHDGGRCRSDSLCSSMQSNSEAENTIADRVIMCGDSGDDRKIWQHPIFENVGEAAEIVPQAVLQSSLDYQSVACLLPLHSQGDFTDAIHVLQPLVDAVEAAIKGCESWSCPAALVPSWDFMLKNTVGRPVELQKQLRDHIEDLSDIGTAEASLQKGWLKQYRREMKEEFRSIQRRLVHDLGILQFILEDGRKKAVAATEAEAFAVEGAARAAERQRSETLQLQQTRALSQDQLQALIASRLSRPSTQP